MPKLEDFQKGIPLNDELKRLKDGVLFETAEEEAPFEWNPDDPDRELSDDERQDLARLLREPGWRVLKRLRIRTLRQMEKAATLLSKQNPLGQPQDIAVGWANVAAFEHQMKMDQAMVEAEIQRLRLPRSDESHTREYEQNGRD